MTNEKFNYNDTEITLDHAIELMKAEVDRALSASPYIIRGYTEHLKTSRGKYIRGISLLTCAENKDGLIHYNAIKFSAAIEILHLATLVHDDVIDNAGTRRGVITLQKKYGKRTAVICGDYLLSVALKLAASIPDKQDYLDLNIPNYMSMVCLGELNQHINNGNLNLSIFQYLKIISGKTAALFEASFYGGAILSGCDNSELKKYKKLGRFIGMIFQLSDDLLDFKTEEIARKPVHSDYENGVVTLPLIHTFTKLTNFKEKARYEKVTREEINTAVKSSGGLDFTRMISKKYYDKSIEIINELDITENKKNKLMFILDKAFGEY